MRRATPGPGSTTTRRARARRAAVVGTVLLALALAGCAGRGGTGAPGSASGTAGTPLPTSASSGPTSHPTPSPTGGSTTSRTGTSKARGTGSRTTAATGSSATPRATAPAVGVGRNAWVAVSVATLWHSPSSPRAVDRPSLTAPAAIRSWLAQMSVADRRGLVGRADTQALLGDRVVVVARTGSWAKVVVPDQPTPLDGRGYPGWVPVAQLTARAPAPAALVATVTAATTWLRTDDAAHRAVVEVSFGTRLPRVGSSGGWVRVSTPTGRLLQVGAGAVAVRPPAAAALPASGSELVRAARMFTGLPYLWAGRSGFGYDCSGLTSLDYRVHGIVIPRDADAQAVRGRAVARSALQPGDLLFYATSSGYVHHVAMYAADGRMVQAPRTGASVETVTVSTSGYAGARRFL